MKKFGSIIAAIFIIVALASSAFAFRSLGAVTTDQTGIFAIDGLAAKTQIVVKVTKGYYNFDATPYAKFKVFFTKTSDNTSTLGKLLIGGSATGSEAGMATSSETLVRGSKVNTYGFGVYSSAGTNINILAQ